MVIVMNKNFDDKSVVDEENTFEEDIQELKEGDGRDDVFTIMCHFLEFFLYMLFAIPSLAFVIYCIFFSKMIEGVLSGILFSFVGIYALCMALDNLLYMIKAIKILKTREEKSIRVKDVKVFLLILVVLISIFYVYTMIFKSASDVNKAFILLIIAVISFLLLEFIVFLISRKNDDDEPIFTIHKKRKNKK